MQKPIKYFAKEGKKMGLGNKILNLRKKLNLSQEQLAEQLNVTRQTISKWELEETAPDIKQAKKLSEIFKVSLDELLDTDIRDTVVEKVSNTEKLTNMAVKIVKVIGIAFFVMLIIDIITMIILLPKIV